MVRISTVWDKIDDVNTKVFMVRGDESYARTTNVQISLKDSVSGASNGFVATAIVDVLRDTGNSSITFYDGEDVLTVVDWSYSNSNMEVQLPRLSWDNEHLIWARYNGNTECLKSKSDVVSISKPNPDLTDTTITNTTSVINYTSSDDITITGKLNKVTGSASLQGREISFYADGIFKGTANTSDTSGNVSKNIGTLSNGNHEIAIVFNGDNPLGASETKFNISVGYKLTLQEYPKTFINGINNTVKVKVTNYMGDPVSGKSVSFASKSATTDSNGIATISNITSITNNATYYASHSGYTSDNIVMKSATLNDIEISTEDGITVNGMAEPVTINVTGTGTLSNIPVRVSYDYTNKTYMTNNSGMVIFDYMGDSRGDVNIVAYAKDDFLSTSTLINDLLYYMKARKFANVERMEASRITIDEQSSYIITPTSNSQYGYLRFFIPSQNWKAEFTLVNFSGKYRAGIEIQGQALNSANNLGDKYRVIQDDEGCRVWCNDELIHSDYIHWDSLWFMVNNGTGTVKCRMFFDDLKIWSLD